MLSLMFALEAGGQRHSHLQPVDVESAVRTIEPEAPGTYFLEMVATVPPNRDDVGVRYSVWVDDQQVVEQMGRGSWDVNSIPYFAIDTDDAEARRRGEGAALLRYVMPLKVEAGQKVHVTYPKKGGEFFDAKVRPAITPDWEGTIHDVRLRPALQGLDATMSTAHVHNVFFTSEKPRATIAISGPAETRIEGHVALQSLVMADSLGGNNWTPDIRVTEVARVRTVPMEATFDAEGKATVSVDIPRDRHRLIGVTLVAERGGQRRHKYLGSVAVVPSRDTRDWHRDGFFLVSSHLDVRKGKPNSRATGFGAGPFLEALKKAAIDWVRQPFFWGMWEPQEGQVRWDETDALMDVLAEHRINLMHIVGPVPNWARTPETDQMVASGYRGGWKVDTTPAPENLDAFREAHVKFFDKYRDMVRATNVWNEPWEGFGITGWMATGEYYRRILRQIRAAADAVDPPLDVIAADSPHNTQWKLFAAGMTDQIDAISTHYMDPMSGHAFGLAKYYDKELWETETWLAWRGDANSVRHALGYLALGGTRISLWHPNMLFTNRDHPQTSIVWASAMRHALRGAAFREIVHPERPPFALLFEGDDADRHVAVLLTTVTSRGGKSGEVFRQAFIDDDVRMHLPDDDRLRVLDMHANPVEPETDASGRQVVAVGRTPRYVEFNGPVEEFRKILTDAPYSGLTPVEITIEGDVTRRWSDGPAIAVNLRNAYDRPVRGEVSVKVDGLTLESNRAAVELGPVEEKRFEFPVTGRTTEGNRFPVEVAVETPVGSAHHAETVYQALIVRGTPSVDGSIDEWQGLGAVPVTMSASPGELGPDLSEQAWFPWRDFAAQAGQFTAQFAFAHDDEHLYLMARVHDPSRSESPPMLSGEQFHKFQVGAEHIYLKPGPTPAAGGDLIQWAMAFTRQYDPKYEVFPPDHPLHGLGASLRNQYLYMIYPTNDGGAEIMRVRKPGFYYVHPLPIDYDWLSEHCKVPGSRVEVSRLDEGYVYEIALPWSELDQLPHDLGARVRMNVLVQNNRSADRLEWSAGRSRATKSHIEMEPGWVSGWTNETWWGFVGESGE